MQDEHTERVYESQDETQALALQAVLTDAGIDCALLNHRDRAYPGIVDRVAGGTEILVASEDADRARALIDEFLAAEPISPEEQAQLASQAPAESAAPGGSGAWFMPALLIFAALIGIAWWMSSR